MTRPLISHELSRKTFLKGGGTLALGLTAAGTARAANNPTAVSQLHLGAVPGPPDPAQIDSWLQVNPDNTVTLFHGWTEMGQGSPTAIRQIAAEELGLSFDQVAAVQLDTNVSVQEFAAASSSTRTAILPTSMRGAAAAARTVLVGMAAAQLGVAGSALSVRNGVVSGGGKTVKYSDLMAGKTFNTTIAAVSPVLTDPSSFRLIGTRVPRIDIPSIATGTATYIQNVRVPGMLHGRVVRPRGQAAQIAAATLLSFDKGSIAHIPDVQIVQKGNFLGVVAPREYDAIQAAAELKATWSEAPTLTGDGNLEGALRDPANLQRTSRAVDIGDVDAGLASAARVVSASYFWPYQLHGAMGPNCSIAEVGAQSATVICMAQGPYSTRQAIATALALPPTSVRVEVFRGSGNYGHNTYDDVSISAALLSQAVGKPIRVQFMRWDEHGWDQFGPAQATDVRAGVDTAGNIVAFDYRAFNHGWTQVVESAAQLAGIPLPPVAPPAMTDTVSSGSFYKIPNRRVTSNSVNGYGPFMKGTYLRAPGAPQALFAAEQAVDALAHAAKMDPIAFRVQNIDASDTKGNARWIAVLDAVGHASNWKPMVSASNVGTGNVVAGRGVAMGGFANAFPAVVADINVNKKTGKITVDHLFAAQDAGTTVNPASVENQMEGCLVQGTSRALFEQVNFTRVRQSSLDWVTYPILRFNEAPAVTTVVLQRLDQPAAGSGEPTTAAVAAAIANAFFDATGVRLYRTPMTPGYVRTALKP
ncbi:MAG TPA: molybdopterin cofactor-binding domain-containing protein [Gaiellaceae bacterium]|nr:molybdopterin cofactor-binding domain-containing protein [Gaiellaceae bacterium]